MHFPGVAKQLPRNALGVPSCIDCPSLPLLVSAVSRTSMHIQDIEIGQLATPELRYD
jgi:hypothetical protein